MSKTPLETFITLMFETVDDFGIEFYQIDDITFGRFTDHLNEDVMNFTNYFPFYGLEELQKYMTPNCRFGFYRENQIVMNINFTRRTSIPKIIKFITERCK